MGIGINLRKKIRKLILPLSDMIQVLAGAGLKYEICLDIGAGTGIFITELFERGMIKKGIGIEVNPGYFRKINDFLSIINLDTAEKSYAFRCDLLLFNDVLHHVKNKEEFITFYTSKFLKPGGYVFIKDMNNRNLFLHCLTVYMILFLQVIEFRKYLLPG